MNLLGIELFEKNKYTFKKKFINIYYLFKKIKNTKKINANNALLSTSSINIPTF